MFFDYISNTVQLSCDTVIQISGNIGRVLAGKRVAATKQNQKPESQHRVPDNVHRRLEVHRRLKVHQAVIGGEC